MKIFERIDASWRTHEKTVMLPMVYDQLSWRTYLHLKRMPLIEWPCPAVSGGHGLTRPTLINRVRSPP